MTNTEKLDIIERSLIDQIEYGMITVEKANEIHNLAYKIYGDPGIKQPSLKDIYLENSKEESPLYKKLKSNMVGNTSGYINDLLKS